MSGSETTYTPEAGARICDRLAAGESLLEICRTDDTPDRVTVYRWARQFPEFEKAYRQAREDQAWGLFEELQEIADDGTNDWMQRNAEDNPGWVANGEHINRSRLRVDTRKWMLAKMLPKVMGDSTLLKHGDPDGNALRVVVEIVDSAAADERP